MVLRRMPDLESITARFELSLKIPRTIYPDAHFDGFADSKKRSNRIDFDKLREYTIA
jgi:hypothetical protein